MKKGLLLFFECCSLICSRISRWSARCSICWMEKGREEWKEYLQRWNHTTYEIQWYHKTSVVQPMPMPCSACSYDISSQRRTNENFTSFGKCYCVWDPFRVTIHTFSEAIYCEPFSQCHFGIGNVHCLRIVPRWALLYRISFE